jgi:hypothetical protein
MERITLSSKGQVAIPKAIRDQLSQEPAWKKLRGAAAGKDFMKQFASFRKGERKLENSGD